MAIIGTLPSRFSDKNQQLHKGSLIRATSMHTKIIYISIQGKSIGNIQNPEGCIDYIEIIWQKHEKMVIIGPRPVELVL